MLYLAATSLDLKTAFHIAVFSAYSILVIIQYLVDLLAMSGWMFDTDGQTFGLWVLLLRSRAPSSGGGQIFSRGALEKAS